MGFSVGTGLQVIFIGCDWHTWEKSRFPKGQDVNGKKFYHALDDTKDHWADRRSDLSYMIAPEESIELEKWMKQLSSVIRDYAKKNNVHARAGGAEIGKLGSGTGSLYRSP
jgi:hypothetical protein